MHWLTGSKPKQCW